MLRIVNVAVHSKAHCRSIVLVRMGIDAKSKTNTSFTSAILRSIIHHLCSSPSTAKKIRQ